MKKGLLTIFIIVTCVFLSECKKDPKPDVFRVTEVDVDASYKTAEINGSYTFSVIPDDMKIVYGEKDDLTDAISSKVNVGESAFHVNINNLSTETKYYYCFECYSSHSSTRSEVHSFVTLKAEKPVVETGAVENITLTFATCGGNVVSDCGADVTERGVCWSTSQNPTINDNKTSDGAGIGTYNSSITGLNKNTTYYVRAYASNSVGTAYGDEKSFTTADEVLVPVVATISVDGITQTEAECKAEVVTDGGASVTERGVCWSTSPNPTINDNITTNGNGTGTFTSNLINLTANTTYYVRAYANNSAGTGYGNEISFTTLKDIVKPTVKTNEVSSVVQDAAICGGVVIVDGGAEVTARGVCWSTSQNPTINGSHTDDGTGEGDFTSTITGLTAGTTYYVRAYATNEKGTSYGEEKSFMTSIYMDLPILTTKEIDDITETSATSGGEVVSDGGAPVIARGICWSISQDPTIDDNDGMTTDGNGTGTFTSDLVNLTANTTYYVRAYATNEKGTSYGDEISFTTEEEDEEGCEPDGEIAGHYYVDLGLPSGVKWATCNVGASSPEDYGDYFAWGETSPKAEYTWGNSVTYGEQMSDISGNAQYDAATANWGGSWRMPTKEQMEELVEHCEWEWTEVNGVNGAKVIGTNGSCIFLPAAGVRDGSSLGYDGDFGHYWSSTPNDYDYDSDAYILDFGDGYESVNWTNYRYFGLTVRPISGGNTTEPTLPTVTTSSVTDVTTNSAISGGNVTSDGGATVTARGICWSTSQNPTIDDNDGMTTDGNGTGTFTSDLVNLTANTTYYVRAYATNVMGTAYGEQRSFTTEEEEAELTPPTVITSEVIDITETTAVSGGNVTDDGGATVTARGICWSTSHNPTIDDNDGITTDGNGTGTFTSNLINLTANTTYYVRAYATNEKGTSYGDEMSFTTEEEDEEGCEPDGEIAGHYYVDLGLPSGVKWATCNVGASSPEDYGDYFAWGETSPKAEYTWENSVTFGEQMSDISGNAQYDAATANWGGSWRMPTREQMEELVVHCEWEWTQVNGVYGSKVIGPNGSCIFLPAAGRRHGSSLDLDGSYGYYWSSTPDDYSYDYRAYDLYFSNGHEYVNWSYDRCTGLTVRPLTE